MIIERLKVFCDVVDLKSFSRAAEANFVTQSSVSQQIHDLQKHWGTALIDGRGNRMRLTHAGQVVYEKSKAILQYYQDIKNELEKSSNQVRGNIRVSTIATVGLYELPFFVKNFMHDYPEVNIGIKYRRDDEVYEDVLKWRSDLGIVAYPRERPGLEIVPFNEDRLVIICPPKHRLARKKKIEIREIAGEKFVAFEQGIPTRNAIDQMLRKNNISVQIVMEFDNVETLKSAVEVGSGVSIVPQTTCRREAENGTLASIEVSDWRLIRPIGIVLHSGRSLSIPLSRFVASLSESRTAQK